MAHRGWATGRQATRRRFAAADVPFLLWRERPTILGVFGIVFLTSLIASLVIRTSYTADVSILVRPGQEYVYEPWIGDAGRGAMLDPAAMVTAEAEILDARPLKLRIIERLGLEAVDPDLADRYKSASPAEKPDIVAAAARSIEGRLQIETKGPLLRARLRDRDPRRAALLLNTLVDEYLVYRRSLLIDPGSSAVLATQRALFEERLAQADDAVAEFNQAHGVTDVAAESALAAELEAALDVQRREAWLRLQERSARLAALQASVRAGEDVSKARLASLTAEVASLKKTQEQWATEARRLGERRRQLASLALEADAMSLAREVRRAGMRDFLIREERSWTVREITGPSNVRVVERPVPPAGGESPRGLVIVLGLLTAMLAGLGAGLLRMSLRPGLPMPRTASATLGLPVLGAAASKAR